MESLTQELVDSSYSALYRIVSCVLQLVVVTKTDIEEYFSFFFFDIKVTSHISSLIIKADLEFHCVANLKVKDKASEANVCFTNY